MFKECNKNTFDLIGELVTQKELTQAINTAFKINLTYKSLSVKEYTDQRKEELGERLVKVIGGIYEGIRSGEYGGNSDYEQVTGHKHQSLEEMINSFINDKCNLYTN